VSAAYNNVPIIMAGIRTAYDLSPLGMVVGYWAEKNGQDSSLFPDADRGFQTLYGAARNIGGTAEFLINNAELLKEVPELIIKSEMEPFLAALDKGRPAEAAGRGAMTMASMMSAVLPLFRGIKLAGVSEISAVLLKLADRLDPKAFAEAAKEMISIKRLAGDLDSLVSGARDSGTLNRILELGELTEDEIKKLAKNGLLSDEEAKKALKALEDKKVGKDGVTITEEAGTEGDGPKKATSASDLSKKEFENPKEAYDYINNLDDDVGILANRKIKGFNNDEANLLKEHIREDLPLEDYPDIDYKKIDDVINNGIGKQFGEQDFKDLKKYIFDNSDFKPPYKEVDRDFFPGFEKNVKEWGRLIDGEINENSFTFIKHEFAEMRIKEAIQYDNLVGADRRMAHMDVHDSVLKIFNTEN